MLEALITSKTRLNLLLKFFLNSNNKAWLRSLETEFGESTNAIRLELNRFQKAGLLVAAPYGNKKIYMANTDHPLYDDIHKLLFKHIGLNKVIDRITSKLGDLEAIYLIGELAKGKNSNVIDLWFVGKHIDKKYLLNLVEKTEENIKRKVRYIVLSNDELNNFLSLKSKDEILLIWKE